MQPALRFSHLKRNVAVVLGLVLILATAAVLVSSFVFGLYGCFGRCAPFRGIYPTSLSCEISEASCKTTISNNETGSAIAIGCEFQSIYAINGNNQSLTTVELGPGVLSNTSGGAAMNLTIEAGSSATVYCTYAAHTHNHVNPFFPFKDLQLRSAQGSLSVNIGDGFCTQSPPCCKRASQ